jgi:hypothetical protein
MTARRKRLGTGGLWKQTGHRAAATESHSSGRCAPATPCLCRVQTRVRFTHGVCIHMGLSHCASAMAPVAMRCVQGADSLGATSSAIWRVGRVASSM